MLKTKDTCLLCMIVKTDLLFCNPCQAKLASLTFDQMAVLRAFVGLKQHETVHSLEGEFKVIRRTLHTERLAVVA